MRLEAPSRTQLAELRDWFPSAEAIASWGGPGMRFPNTAAEFEQDLNLQGQASYALISQNRLIGFGQFYERLQHCHLGRLAIAPQFRGQGYASELIYRLLDVGKSTLGMTQASLFVLNNNEIAIRAYLKLGFVETTYPEAMPLEGCLYLTKKI